MIFVKTRRSLVREKGRRLDFDNGGFEFDFPHIVTKMRQGLANFTELGSDIAFVWACFASANFRSFGMLGGGSGSILPGR